MEEMTEEELEELKLELYMELHSAVRRLFRYEGVDKKEYDRSMQFLREANYKVTLFFTSPMPTRDMFE